MINDISRTDWFGSIPDNWETTTIGQIFANRNIRVSENEYKPLSVTMNGIVPQLDSAVKTEDKENRKLIKRGDFVINGRSDRRGAFGVSEYDGCCSLINIVLAPVLNDVRYYQYMFFTPHFPDEFYRWGNGIVSDLWTTRWDSMKRIIMPNPPVEERNEIVHILDSKCLRIHKAIQSEEKTISNLINARQAIIDQNVVSSISSAPFRDSGHAWMKRIPENWEVVYSKRLFKQSKEKAHPNDMQLTSSQKYGIISQQEYMDRENSRIVLSTKGKESWIHVDPFDFIISLRSFQGGLEMSTTSGCITWHYVVLKPSAEVYPNYYKWLFKSTNYISALQSTCNFIRDGQDLRYSNFAQVYLPLPPIDEQKKIAGYLDEKCEAIDRAISNSRTIIQELHNFEKATIYEYATGKRKVV